jgi:murein DD-endopeptidase MepM/ murein hydrolase activator NlpD
MALPAPKGALGRITARWRYSSGAGHFAYDYAMPTGTPLYATNDGKIADCRDNVVDKTPGRPGNLPGQRGSGSPSNWVLLETRDRYGRKVTVFYQHLVDTKVTKGQSVKAGQLIGYSGQTGNATGAHLHIAAMKGWGYTEATRYAYMRNDGDNGAIIYPPTKAWDGVKSSPLATRARRYTTVGVTTLALIAGAFGVTTAAVDRANPALPNTVKPGVSVVIPPGSKPKPVKVKGRVSAATKPVVKVGSRITVTGRAYPRITTVTLQRYSVGKWRYVTKAKVRPSGRFTLTTAKTTKVRKYAYRVVLPATSLSTGARTGVLRVKVTR